MLLYKEKCVWQEERIRKIRSQEELAFKDASLERERNPIPEPHANVFSALQGSHTPVRIEATPKPKKIRESQPGTQQQQQQHHHYNRTRSKRLMKRLKTRSVLGTSLDVDDNHLSELVPDPIHKVHKEDAIRIEPVVRVNKKHSIFDSIVDIVQQLLSPTKDEPGPLVGPIQIPGSGRKIYVRLMEPVEASHVMVRFITQVPVPTADSENKPIFRLPPVLHPADVLLRHAHGSHHGHHTLSASNTRFESLPSNRYRVIHSPPQNISFNHAPVKEEGVKTPLLHDKSIVFPSSPLKSPTKDLVEDVSDTDDEDEPLRSPAAVLNKVELPNTRARPMTNEQQLPFDPSDAYYQFQSAENIVKDLLNQTSVENETTVGNADGGTKVPAEPWHQLSTYRLPLRQVAPLYPLTSLKHTDPSSSSYADTYKVPSDVLTGPSSYSSSSYERYHDASAASGFVSSSREHQDYSAPDSYSTPFNSKPSDDYNVPSAFSTPYRQNEFSNVPSPYSASYENELGSVPSSYSASSERQNDLLSAPSSYSGSYERGTVPLSSSSYESFRGRQSSVRATSRPYAASYEKENNSETAPGSHDALRVIDPPYFSGYPRQSSENRDADRSFERTTTRQPRYNPRNINEIISSVGQSDESSRLKQVTWGKPKPQKSESPTNLRNSFEISAEVENSSENWQPVVYAHENAGWHEAFADLIGPESDGYRETTRYQQHQQQQQWQRQRPRQKPADWPQKTSSERGKRRDQRQNGVKAASTQSHRCSSKDESNGCERTRATTTSTPGPEKITRIVVDEQTPRSITDSIPEIIPESTAASNVIETDALKLDASTEIPTTSTTTSNVTVKPSPLIRTTKSSATNNLTERPALLIKTTKSTSANSITEKLLSLRTIKNPIASGKVRSTAMGKSTSDTTEGKSTTTSAPRSTTMKPLLPKRPMIMKKSMLIMNRRGFELGNTTQKPATSSTTTKRTFTARKSKFRSAIARTKSSTT
ncbi:hypothetical protein DMN91_008990 [Ooceraea biroi]|uniref:Uncharacterized protein n=1 Tax=Ooceraea biroi TaxID=2015173 RepID=A0A3L8DEQ0_OOCBI|nr:hypothetical protein DMN91_008990 [Ooceraea biroi]